jgi:hypothetical protein
MSVLKSQEERLNIKIDNINRQYDMGLFVELVNGHFYLYSPYGDISKEKTFLELVSYLNGVFDGLSKFSHHKPSF